MSLLHRNMACYALLHQFISCVERLCLLSSVSCLLHPRLLRHAHSSKALLAANAGLSNAAVRGMVAAYTGATTVSLARCAGQLRHTVAFANMFAALSRGAAARLQGQALTRLDLKGCIALRTKDITTLCEHFDSLR